MRRDLIISKPRIAFSRFVSYTRYDLIVGGHPRVNPFELDPKEYIPVLALLKQIDFLETVPEAELKNILFSLQKQNFEGGKTILFQGEIANRLFVIRRGSVSITTKNKG